MEVGRYIDFHNADVEVGTVDYDVRLDTGSTATRTDLYVRRGTDGLGGKIYHSLNDGPGSAIDADTVDGKHASEIFAEPPADGKLYARRRTAAGVASWVVIEAPWSTDGTDVVLNFGATTAKVRIRNDGFIRTASDIQIYSTTVA
jgi:hypothetical protein